MASARGSPCRLSRSRRHPPRPTPCAQVTWETRKIMNLPDLPVSCTCVRIPTLRAHAESITIETEKPIDIAVAIAALNAAPALTAYAKADLPARLRFKASADSFSPRGKMACASMHSLKWNSRSPSRTSSNHLMNDGPFVRLSKSY